MLVLLEELSVGELRVEVPLDHFHPLQACCHLLVDPWPSAPVGGNRLPGRSKGRSALGA